MPSIATYDPGGLVDNFAMLTSNVSRTEILLTDAITWNQEKTENFSYEYVIDKIAQFNQTFKFDYHICESNNTGVPVIHALKYRKKIPVIGINTSNTVKKLSTIRKGASMNSNNAVEWINILRQKGVIKFPAKMTPGLMELKSEFDNFGGKKSGDKIKYQAIKGHDDLVSCAKILVHFAKMKFLKLPEIVGEFKFNGASQSLYQESKPITKHDQARELAMRLMSSKPTIYDKVETSFF